jgi:hypothetical protein
MQFFKIAIYNYHFLGWVVGQSGQIKDLKKNRMIQGDTNK